MIDRSSTRLQWRDVTRPGSLFFTRGAQSRVGARACVDALGVQSSDHAFASCHAQHGRLYFVDAKGVVLERQLDTNSWRALSGPINPESRPDPTASTLLAGR